MVHEVDATHGIENHDPVGRGPQRDGEHLDLRTGIQHPGREEQGVCLPPRVSSCGGTCARAGNPRSIRHRIDAARG
ncbi:MAG: hypothetical protein E6J76_16245 [Deltaproteobacteria bacterium]|nr:MAG: hypothetical protein E6J76_16245 [Deltaproteobacteria bacterium]